jgi:TolA-binding protein
VKLAGLAVAVTAALLCAGRATARPDPNKLPPTRVQDLHYGDVLFYFFQGDDFEAITRLNAYDHWGLMPHHTAESQLLLGGLYLSLGLHNEAGVRFEKLLTPDVPVGVRNRAWFYLAQVWYARGYLDRTEQALRQVQGKLPAQLDAQRTHLLANVLLRQGRFDEAVQLLKDWHGSPDWVAYAQFNLGVALVREGKVDEADAILASVGELGTAQPEMLALRDRANLALGFAYLQANKPDKALPILQRVRLNGPYSNKALLGVGWAQAALGDYKGALVPWLTLRGRNLLDAAVQESYLAVPYAYAKLNANAQAADNYEDALRSFALEGQNLDESVQRIRDGKMLDALLTGDQDTRYGWFWQLQSLPAAPESRYLYPLLADHDFQEGLKNFRDLGYMGHTLERWSDSMEAFSDMIDTREHAYAQRLPRVDALLTSGAADKMQHERDSLETRLNVIERANDVAAIGAPDERAQWARIRELEAALSQAPNDDASNALRERLRLVKGVLYFRLNDAFKARVWQERRTIKDLDLALREAQNRWVRVEKARSSVTANTGEFAERLAALKARIAALQVRLAGMEQKQNEYLQQLAVAELAAQKDRLATYEVQARFALASMYDRAANAPKPAPANPPPPRAEEQPAAPSDAPAKSEPPPSPNPPDLKP